MKLSAMKHLGGAMVTALLAMTGCGGEPGESFESEEFLGMEEQGVADGAFLFKHEKFNGNGRTCETCHTGAGGPGGTGTLNPQQVRARWNANRFDPLFRTIDSDGRLGTSYQQLLSDATVTVDIPLPPNVKLANNPSATSVTLRRGIPTTNDTPMLDPVLMWDARQPTLTAQAKSAILGHAQAGRTPSDDELTRIANFERTLFSSSKTRNFAATGVAPTLPPGHTASEKRGREFFNPDRQCGWCHSGPMLNQASAFNPFGQLEGDRFSRVGVSQRNVTGQPVLEYLVTANGTTQHLFSADPGAMLTTGDPNHLDVFKVPTLWNIKNTAPYFHDNSAKTLEELAHHYTLVFAPKGVTLTPQDEADIAAWLKLL